MDANTKTNNSFSIVVDDGSVKEVIKNKYGDEIGVFYFRPTDLGMIERYNEIVSEDFEKIVEPLISLNINPDGTSDTDEGTNALKEASKRLYEKLNYVFGGDMAEGFFGKINPFSIVGGKFYCENAIAALGDYISAKHAVETRKLTQRINKYTHGYKTGKHSGGKMPANKKRK